MRLVDEMGLDWDKKPGWIRQQDLESLLKKASRAIVHDEFFRETREPEHGEISKLISQVSLDGASGDVCVAEYTRGTQFLLLFSIIDGPP